MALDGASPPSSPPEESSAKHVSHKEGNGNLGDPKQNRSPDTETGNASPLVADENDQDQPAEEDESSMNPDDEMDPFDWEDLESRYYAAMDQGRGQEQHLLEEFDSLCQYFGVWAEIISGHEENRSYRRLRTQTAFVQKQEEELEERRAHYVQVVNAFQQALSLLNR